MSAARSQFRHAWRAVRLLATGGAVRLTHAPRIAEACRLAYVTRRESVAPLSRRLAYRQAGERTRLPAAGVPIA